jgi:FdhD protein
VCGKASIESIHQHFPPVTSLVEVEAQVLLQLPDRLRAAQRTFDCTGGLHATAVFSRSGECLLLREDVGRHNALDKVIGAGLLTGPWPLETHVLLVSGRVSFEIMQKALAARIPIVATISAPSSLAVEFARESGQTLVGFLRGQGMNIYTEPRRVIGRKESSIPGQP